MSYQWNHVPRTRPRASSADSVDSRRTYQPRTFPNEPPKTDPPLDFVDDEGDPLRTNLPRHYPSPNPSGEASKDYNDIPTFPERPTYDQEKGLNMSHSTLLAGFDPCPNDPNHPSSMPIYQTSTFVQPCSREFGPYDYTRSGNPTRTALETLIAKLEGAYAAFAFGSGMSALSCLTRLCAAGDEILACADLYGGMHRLLSQVCARQGITVRFIDTTKIDTVENEVSAKTAILHVESPSNPLMRISDLRRISEVCSKYQTLLTVDNTMMSPILMRPLDLGADVVMHSATKFLNGHSDVMAGVLCTKREDLAKRLAFLQNAEGLALAPFDCWLCLRGMKTMSLRVERQQENANRIAKFLRTQRRVKALHYAGLAQSPDGMVQGVDGSPIRDPVSTKDSHHKTHLSQARGGGSVISFETGDIEFSRRVIDALRLFKITVSFGSVNSLVEMPCTMSHASITSDKRTLPLDLVRISIGIEDYKDLIDDLGRAFRCAESDVEDVRTIDGEPPAPRSGAREASDTSDLGSDGVEAGEVDLPKLEELDDM